MNIELAKTELDKIGFDYDKWKSAMPENISRRKVAKALDTTDSNLLAIEKGKSKPSILLAFKFCKLTNLHISELVKNN